MKNSNDKIERGKAEESLEASQRFLTRMVNTIPDVFYVFDSDGKFILWNVALEKVTGYSHEEISKMRPTDFFDKIGAVNIAQAIKVAFEKGFNTAEDNFLTKDGRRIPMFFSGSLAQDLSGRPIICGTGKNIAERKKMEEDLKDKIRDMEILLDSAMGREEKMVELKERIAVLEEKLKNRGS